MFTNIGGESNRPIKFVIGIPNCGSMQMWPIYHYTGVSLRYIN